MTKKLTETVINVSFSCSQWTARKLDRKVSQEIADTKHASVNAGRYNKQVIAKEALKKIQQIANAARTYHYENTLPYNNAGVQMLPVKRFDEYTSKMREYKGQFEQAVAELLPEYPALIEQARETLGDMFNIDDYPPSHQIARKFSFSVDFTPVPDGENFKVDIQQDILNSISRDIEQRTNEIQAKAMRHLWDRVYNAVSHMANVLSKQEKIFRDSLVWNLCELADILPDMNITDDPNLEHMRKAIQEKLCVYDPQTLRDDTKARGETAKQAEDIISAMAGYMGA